jgi:hypothetical protein
MWLCSVVLERGNTELSLIQLKNIHHFLIYVLVNDCGVEGNTSCVYTAAFIDSIKPEIK